ncbi:MAG: protein kinase, partial [Nitrospinota bacterium]
AHVRLFATEDPKKVDALYQQSEWNKIIQLLGKKPPQEYDDIRLLNDLAVAYHQSEKFDQALAVCEQISKLEPNPDLGRQQTELTPRYMRYHAIMGEVLYRKGEMDKALDIFNRLKVVGTRFSDKYYYAGRIHTKKGNYRMALFEFKGMVDNVPNRIRDAIRGMNELIAASPAQADVYPQLFRACQQSGKLDEYLARYKKEMGEAPGSLPASLKLAGLLFYKGDPAGAEKLLSALKPKDNKEKGWVELIRGDWALAGKGTPGAMAHFQAAEGLLAPGDLTLIERLEDLLRRPDAGPDIRRKLAKLSEAGGDIDRACRHLEALVAAQPADAEAKKALGGVLRKLMAEGFAANDMEKAAGAADRLTQYFPQDAEAAAQAQQIRQVLQSRRKEELERILATGKVLPSRAAQAHFEMAALERAAGGGEDVILSHLQKAAVERSPVRAEALGQMSRIHLEKGAFDVAEGVLDILFSLKLAEENRLEWGYDAAELFEAKGQRKQAQKYYAMVASADPGFRGAAAKVQALSQALQAAPQAAAPAAPAGPVDPMQFLSRRYDNIVELGRGAMGVVYKARDKILDRQVAIKMILGDLGKDPEALGRFITEAQSAAALEHPGIITIYDIRTEDPIYIVMEFVDGKSLGDLVGGRKLPVAQFVKLAIRVCEPMAFAHQAQVVHRDIKPDNIMVTKNGGVKVADFGLARKGGGSGMTQVGQVMGTPFYMAPEQIRGGAVDGRSDIYALGIMFYELLTGSVPFKEGDIAYLHMHEEPPKLSLRNPEISKVLEDVILKCLKKQPEERFQKVEEILEALNALA